MSKVKDNNRNEYRNRGRKRVSIDGHNATHDTKHSTGTSQRTTQRQDLITTLPRIQCLSLLSFSMQVASRSAKSRSIGPGIGAR